MSPGLSPYPGEGCLKAICYNRTHQSKGWQEIAYGAFLDGFLPAFLRVAAQLLQLSYLSQFFGSP